MPQNIGDPPQHFISEPLRSFAPKKLENGDIRMAIAKAGQKAYSMRGEEATLTKEFLSKDFSTWDEGLVSINHENNHEWVKATLYDPEYDPENELVICSFSGLPEWVVSLIYSEDYRGLSQECIPVKFAKNSMDVVRGFGTGVTIVTAPYEPAANQGMGVGIRPELSAILASKYPTQIEDTMSETKGGGTPAISVETYESVVSEKAQLVSRVSALESEKTKLETELASTRKEFESYKAGEAERTKLAYSEGKADGRAEIIAETERSTAIEEFKQTHSKEFVEAFLSTNPSIEQIKILTAGKKVDLSKGPGTSQSYQPEDDGESYESINRRFNELLGRA